MEREILTGVFATKAETDKIHQAAAEAAKVPVMFFGEVNTSHMAWKSVFRMVGDTAKKHGLDPDEHEYGFSTEGEFIYLEGH